MITTIRVGERFKTYRLIQFSSDPIVAKGWFRSVEVSTYGGANSIDIQQIDRADGSYDFIVCSHVLEHVPNPRAAISELTRILSAEGMMFLAYPIPITREKTHDWGYPDWSQHGHYRVFGRDFEAEYKNIIPHADVIRARGLDPVTGDDDLVYFVTKSNFWSSRILHCGIDATLV